MKTGTLLIFLLLIHAKVLGQEWGKGCDFKQYEIAALQMLPKGVTLLKSFKVVGFICRHQIEYTCLLNKGTTYVVRIANEDTDRRCIIATLYDPQRNELITSNFNNTIFNGWTFKCKQTGTYYLEFTFKDPQNRCGGAVLGFKR